MSRIRVFAVLLCAAGLVGLLTACGGGGGGGGGDTGSSNWNGMVWNQDTWGPTAP